MLLSTQRHLLYCLLLRGKTLGYRVTLGFNCLLALKQSSLPIATSPLFLPYLYSSGLKFQPFSLVILLFPLDRQSSCSWLQISAAPGILGVGVRAGEKQQLDKLPMHPSGNWRGGEERGGAAEERWRLLWVLYKRV